MVSFLRFIVTTKSFLEAIQPPIQRIGHSGHLCVDRRGQIILLSCVETENTWSFTSVSLTPLYDMVFTHRHEFTF
jgi:hypothetical protein